MRWQSDFQTTHYPEIGQWSEEILRRLAIRRGVKDNLRFRRFCGAHSDDAM
jgi:hypothetical protein